MTQINVAPIQTSDIAASAVTTAKLNDLAVTAAKIAAATITDAKLVVATITGASMATPNQEIIFPFFVSGGQSTGTIKQGFVVPVACTIVGVRGYLDTAATGATVFLVDLMQNGTTLFTTTGNRPTWTAALKPSTTTLPDIVALAAGDFLRLDIIAVGNTIAGSNLAVTVICKLGLVA